MEFKPTEYCKVCRYFDNDVETGSRCTRGNTSYCGMCDFIPSERGVIVNFILEARNKNVIDSEIQNRLFDYLFKTRKEG
jgi:hypothetical protein